MLMRLSTLWPVLPMLFAVLALPLEGRAQTEGNRDLLQVEGMLETGDSTLPDGRFYDSYSFEGKAGQAVVITATSDEFDTFLFLLNSNGEILSENNNWNGDSNSTIGYVIPAEDTYQVWVNATAGNGHYQISISTTTVNDPIVIEFRADELFRQGLNNFQVSQLSDALQAWQSALELYREIGNQSEEGLTLLNLGIAYRNLGQSQRAIEFFEQSLKLYREIDDRLGEGRALSSLGTAYHNLGQPQHAIELFEQSLELYREIGNRAEEGVALGNLGVAYNNLGLYQQAIEFFEEDLAISREVGNYTEERRALNNLGVLFRNIGLYQRAIEIFEQELKIARELGDRSREANTLGRLGIVYGRLDQSQEAIQFFEQALNIHREIGDRGGEAITLSNLGIAYRSLQPQQAIEFFEQSLEIYREIGDRDGELGILLNLGIVYFNLGGRYQHNSGNPYLDLELYQHIVKLYEQSLAFYREIGDRASEEIILGNLGWLFEVQQQPELAVTFYKQAINLRTQISEPLNEPTFRQSYVTEITTTYHRLAQLLLKQERYHEAQQTLELFKLQELSDYTNNQQIITELPTLTLLPEEELVVNTYSSLLKANQRLDTCTKDNCPGIYDLQVLREQAVQQNQSAVEGLTAFIQENGYKGHPLLRDNSFLNQANAIIAQQPGTVLIYPLVLQTTLWIFWISEDHIGSQQIKNVNQQVLAQTISAFRTNLENRYSDLTELQKNANQLYGWLIEPVEEALDSFTDTRHLVLALDRNTRYIPIAALYDGQKYLIEKYDISTILAASLTDTNARAPIGTDNVSLLAAGVSEGFDDFPALPNVPIELDHIVKEQDNNNDQVGIYQGQQLLDPDFTHQTLRNSLSSNTRFLHIATHGEFVPGDRYSSYLLMGNGEKLPLPEIAALGPALKGIHLAVLSACQTALGGSDEEGLEIAGLGYYFFKSEVDAIMASLWNVNDASTSQLMQAFYQALSEGTATNPVTKAEALRTAQLSLLQSNDPGNTGEDRFRRIPKHPNDKPRPESGLAHPYYWAPFILIGNSL